MQNQQADRTPGGRADTPRALVKAVTTLASHLVSTRPGAVYREMLALVEAPLLAYVLALTGGNQVRAARLLGVNRNTLYKRGRQLGLLPPSGGERRSESSLSNSAG